MIRSLIILGIVIILTGIVVFLWHNQKVQDELKGYVDGLSSEKSFPRSLPVGDLIGLYEMDNNCVVLTQSNFALFDSGGAQIFDTPHNLTKARVSANKERIALFGRGGKEVTIRLKDTDLYKKSFDYPITTAVLSPKNKLAVVTGSQSSAAVVTVFDPQLEELYRYSSAAGFVSDVVFSPDESRMAVCSVNAQDGRMISAVTIFQFDQEEPLGRYELPDELILSAVYKKGEIKLIGEKRALSIDEGGQEKAVYDYADQKLYHYSDAGERTALILGGSKEDIDNKLVLLDQNKQASKEVVLEQAVKQLTVQNDRIYLLTDEKILCYNMDGELVKEIGLERPLQKILVTANETIYAADASNILKVQQ